MIKKISNRQRKRLMEYRLARTMYMADHPTCEVCNEVATDCHHQRGRSGSLISDQRFFKALCRTHHDLCRDRPNEARELGILCEKGKWGCSK